LTVRATKHLKIKGFGAQKAGIPDALEADRPRSEDEREGPKQENAAMNTKTTRGLNVKSSIKAAGFGGNHNRTLGGLKVKAAVRGAGLGSGNHNRTLTALSVKSSIKAAGFAPNHNRSLAIL
jgi:hypothetical protein